jgi:hypothetical protein
MFHEAAPEPFHKQFVLLQQFRPLPLSTFICHVYTAVNIHCMIPIVTNPRVDTQRSHAPNNTSMHDRTELKIAEEAAGFASAFGTRR